MAKKPEKTPSAPAAKAPAKAGPAPKAPHASKAHSPSKAPAAPKAHPASKAAPAAKAPPAAKTKSTPPASKHPAKAAPAAKPGPAPAAAPKHGTKESPKKKASHPEKPARPVAAAPARSAQDELRRQVISKARGRAKAQRAVAFTLDDVRGELARSTPARPEIPAKPAPAADNNHTATAANHAAPARQVVLEAKVENRRYEAASLADILGYNPNLTERNSDEEAQVDKRFIRFYKLLIELRDHVKSGLQLHTEDTLKRSNREDSGDLSGYGQHMADAGTDNFDRDFALSLVSNEQEALFEIEEALKRIKKGTYGVCELTGKPINKDRLLAVPFARYSVESQAEIEKVKRRSSNRGGVFGDTVTEEGAKFLEEDSE